MRFEQRQRSAIHPSQRVAPPGERRVAFRYGAQREFAIAIAVIARHLVTETKVLVLQCMSEFMRQDEVADQITLAGLRHRGFERRGRTAVDHYHLAGVEIVKL